MPRPDIRLRRATLADLDLLSAWQRQQHVIDAGAGEDWHWQTELARDPPWRERTMPALYLLRSSGVLKLPSEESLSPS